jgi:dephospho-CoA kinase
MRVIAITGGIGTGKSTAVQMLAAQLGCPSCSCDAVVHALLRTPELLTEIAQRFPGVVTPEGEVDRRRLGDLVFHSEAERRVLESLLHPRVLERVETWIEEHQNGTTFGLVEVPLLYEVDFPLKRDVDVVVACSEQTQIERLSRREGIDGRARDRIAAQLPISEKIFRAEVVIWNEGSLGTLSRLVALAASRIQQKTQ